MSKHVFKYMWSLALVFLFALPGLSNAQGRIIEGVVTKVVDGDTIQVTDSLGTKVKVRFYGIDAPETDKANYRTGMVVKPGQPAGEEAFQALRQKIERQTVRLEVKDVDQYKRTVATVWLGNRNINYEMVSDGWAWAYRPYLERSDAGAFIQAEDQAQRAHRGLWRQSSPQKPWEFRKALKAEGGQSKGRW